MQVFRFIFWITGGPQGAQELAGADTPTVEGEAGFDVKEPAALPRGFNLCSAQYVTASQSVAEYVTIAYCFIDDGKQVGTLSFYQTPLSVEEDLRGNSSA